MKIKFNWGTGIFLSFVIFMGATVSTAVYMMNQDVNLVADDYYDQEIKYQKQIDRIKRTNKLNEKNIILYKGKFVKVAIPKVFLMNNFNGGIHFYRPSDAKSDIKIPLQTDSLGLQVIPVSALEKGLWTIKVNWITGENEYFAEKRIFIN